MAKPTQKDAELLLHMISLMSDEEGRRAFDWFREEFDIKSYRKFKKKLPNGSQGSRHLNRVLNNWEMLATLVLNGLISEDLVFDMFLVKYIWDKVEPIVYGIRKEAKQPRLFENLEVLSQRSIEWDKTHPPKVEASK